MVLSVVPKRDHTVVKNLRLVLSLSLLLFSAFSIFSTEPLYPMQLLCLFSAFLHFLSQILQVNTRWKGSRRDLHNALLCTVLQSQNFSQKSSTFFREWIMNFRLFSFSASNFAFFLRNFNEILSGFRDKFQRRVTCVAFSIKFAKTN